jgi:hypothetical protein
MSVGAAMRKWEEVFGGNRSVGLNSSPQGCTWIEKGHSVRRIVLITLSVMLALVVAMPMVSANPATTEQNPSPPPGQLKKLTAEWWNWAFSTSPSPLEGSYTGGTQCEGEYVEGVFFLAGAAFGSPPTVERTCTVPADTPILFPVFNVVCSAAFDPLQEVDDPKPYHKKCAKPFIDDFADPPSTFLATLNGQDLTLQRIASGQFWWTIPIEDAPFGVPTGTYRAASDGLWVYLEEGLAPGEHTIVFKGSFEDTPGGDFEGTEVTYHLTAV